jgi:hypothetical protein
MRPVAAGLRVEASSHKYSPAAAAAAAASLQAFKQNGAAAGEHIL